MRFTVCPFCGVVSDGQHDSQEACIQALQSEIAQTRHALAQVGDSSTAATATRRESGTRPQDQEDSLPKRIDVLK